MAKRRKGGSVVHAARKLLRDGDATEEDIGVLRAYALDQYLVTNDRTAFDNRIGYIERNLKFHRGE